MKISPLFFLLSVFWVNLGAVETSPAAAPAPTVKEKSLEEIAAQRWTEMNTERIAASADGQPVTLSEIRQQITPFLKEIRSKTRNDDDFNKAIDDLASEILNQIADRQLVIADFKNNMGKIPASYVDADIEDTVRRDFGGDRNRFVAALRTQGLTPLSYRKQIEDRITFEYMIGQVRRSAFNVGPGRILEYFNKHQAEFTHKEVINFRQITINQGAAENATEAKNRADAWALALNDSNKIAPTLAQYKISPRTKGTPSTFSEIAELVSEDDYASKGGNVGWKSLDELNERVVTELKKLKDGEISGCLQFDLPGGKSVWFILKREGYKPAGPDTLEDPLVRDTIENRVRAEAMKSAVDEWLKELRAKNHVEIK
jgi:parvulin-like peptidyl-prolyl isomerase